ncbi:transcription factor Adf-1-like [Homalodisca vitripennis]|uniref:transcription factor Adf-1-like n=1 Tax=Homalodisca vitripennis TaxID=197043 RepID=UPI001EEAFBF2|nr:transcription factor Adf-1-like [Homalodisca vitripennis]
MAAIKAEELIESVRNFPVLYDQTQEQYRNSDYKDIIWKKVAKELNVEGQEEECKKKWNGIRDSLRRARQKRKTKSGQAGTLTNKYKFESILEFLIPHLGERKGLSNVPDEEDISDETQLNDSHQQNSTKESQDVNGIEPQESVESVSLLTPTTPASRP